MIINKPIINRICFYQKIIIRGKSIIKKETEIPTKFIIKTDSLITKVYKKTENDLPYIIKIQNNIKNYLRKENENIILKPINEIVFCTKIRKKEAKIKRIYKIKRNNSFKSLKQKESNKNNQIYFNNIEEFLQDNNGEKINDISKYNTINNSNRKNSKENERNSNLLNDTDENKNATPIRIMNAKIHKSSINYNPDNITNLKTMKNNCTPNNKYINIESLPSINSLKTNTENNELFPLEPNLIINNTKTNNNIITSVSIQTLGSNLSKNKFIDNKKNKRVATEANNYKNCEVEYDNRNYFYTDNDIVKFSFNNEVRNFLDNSIIRTNTSNYFKLIKFINESVLKIFYNKMKEVHDKQCLYVFIQMLIQRIKKYINIIVFNAIFDKNNKNDFYKIIKKHLRIYNKIASDPNIKINYKNNELVMLIKENIFNKYINNKFLFLSEKQEKNFINKDIFISNDKDLINYFLLYYQLEYKPLENSYLNMIQFRLIKEPLYNMNIFSITKYMDKLYNNIIHGNICKTCFCKKEESCSINCNCHISLQNSINLINKIKNRISHYKSVNDNNKDNNSYIEEKSKYNERNIRIIIKKVKRTSADKTRTKNNNSEESSDSKNSNSHEIDVFQKMNVGIESIINKVKINRAFRDLNCERKKQIERTCTEFNGDVKKKKVYNDTLESGYYNLKNHFTTPDKKSCSFLFEKKLLNEK